MRVKLASMDFHRAMIGEMTENCRWRDACLAGQRADVRGMKPALRNDRQRRPGNLFLAGALFGFARRLARALA